MGHIKSNQLKLAGLMDNDIYDIYFSCFVFFLPTHTPNYSQIGDSYWDFQTGGKLGVTVQY